MAVSLFLLLECFNLCQILTLCIDTEINILKTFDVQMACFTHFHFKKYDLEILLCLQSSLSCLLLLLSEHLLNV